jgi:predicted aspartyl protease
MSLRSYGGVDTVTPIAEATELLSKRIAMHNTCRPKGCLKLYVTYLLLLVFLFSAESKASAQFHDTCNTHDLAALVDEAAGKSSRLCRGIAELAMGKSEIGSSILRDVIKQAPGSDAAFEAHERLLGMFARAGRVREAAKEVAALLAIRPNDTDVLEYSSLFETLGQYPDMTVSHRQAVSFPPSKTEGSLNIPFTVNGVASTFFLDTGANYSVMSDGEARAMGLTVTPVTTKMPDSSGHNMTIRITEVQELNIGPIRLKHVPFMVLPASNPPFNEIPLAKQGLLGISVALALQTIRLGLDGQLDLASSSGMATRVATITFDDMTPLLHVDYRGTNIAFTFDTGAERTDLDASFAREFPAVIASGKKKDRNSIGLGGTIDVQALELPTWEITLGSNTVSMDGISVLLGKTNDYSDWAAGNLGIDVLKRFEPFAIDFSNMWLAAEQDIPSAGK